MPLVLRVMNTGPDTAHLGLTGRPVAFDIIVAATLEYTHSWDQRDNRGRTVEPGLYHVEGVIPTEQDELRSDPHEIRIAP